MESNIYWEPTELRAHSSMCSSEELYQLGITHPIFRQEHREIKLQ